MRRSVAVLLILVLSVAQPALGIGTSHWTHTSEADFKNGTFRDVVATNLGDLKLSRSVRTLVEQDARVSVVYALVEAPDGTVYAGTGPEGVLLAVKGEKVSDLATLGNDVNIFALALDARGNLLIGTGGETGRVLRIDPKRPDAGPAEVFAADGVQYVWGVVPTGDGNLYVATGPNGQLFEVKPDGTHAVLLDSNENNLLCLVGDGNDLLYAGTDPNGLVYRINRKTGKTFVVHDAGESEITALALDAKGTLYAGTAEATDTMDGEEPEGATEEVGRPEGGTGGMEIPSQPPKDPAPPEIPDPNPGEPEPIPKSQKRSMGVPPMGHGRDGHATGQWTFPSLTLLLADGAAPQPAQTAPSGGVPAEAGELPESGFAVDSGQPRAGGNAIYRIDPNGFVTEVFRQPVLVLSLVERDGTLLVGTGSDGLVYQIRPAADETLVLAKVDPKQVMSLLPTKDGRVIMGLANVGGLAAMGSGYASEGTYTSPVLDASQISQFGLLRLHGTLPKGSTLKVATRSGNLAEPDETGWSKWSDRVDATAFVKVTSPSARFLQYRLTFGSDEGSESAIVDEVDVAYQVPNLAPQIKSVKVGRSEGGDDAMAAIQAEARGGGAAAASAAAAMPAGSGKQTIIWEASDANADALRYQVFFRTGSRAPWILLEEKLTEPTFEWDTRSMADGRYEVKVVASDEAANPRGTGRTSSRVSEPLVVDNTAPVLGNLKTETRGADAVISLTAVDRSSTLAKFEYAVDAGDDWQTVLPSDTICDGPEESVSFTVPGLKPGPHQVAVRATDARGNRAVQTVLITIDAAAAR